MPINNLLQSIERYTCKNMMISQHSRKIAISFAIVLALSLVMIIYDLSRMKLMQSKLDVITNEHNIKSALMMKMRHGIYQRQVSLRNIMLMTDPFERDIEKTTFNSYALNIVTARDSFASMPLNDKEEKVLKQINATMILAYAAQINLIDTSIYSDTKKITKQDLNKAFKTQEVFMDKVKQMIMLQKQATKKAVMDAGNSYQSAKSSVYILGGSALLFGVFVAMLVIRLTESQARDVNHAMSEIEESHNLLEDRVYKRTKELSQARDQALASNKTKDIFLANMSHELRTPLNIILGYSELLEEIAEEEGSKKIIPDLNKIQHAALHQLELINTILDISKIEEGKLDIHAIDFDVEKLLSEIESSSKPLMSKNNNDFKINCMHGIGMMYSDNMRIRQILLNLLSNAAKFTSQGEISLNVSKDIKVDEITFEVKDNGVGIDEVYMDDLFKKFTQADSSTTKRYGGSGLGLSISKQLCRILHGNISVLSEVGKGSSFTLTLPIVYLE